MPFGEGQRPSLAARFGILVIQVYRMTAALWLGGSCRFLPSCSVYGQQALQRHGAVRGLILTLARVMRCRPWNKSSWFDPVPHSLPTHGGSFRRPLQKPPHDGSAAVECQAASSGNNAARRDSTNQLSRQEATQ